MKCTSYDKSPFLAENCHKIQLHAFITFYMDIWGEKVFFLIIFCLSENMTNNHLAIPQSSNAFVSQIQHISSTFCIILFSVSRCFIDIIKHNNNPRHNSVVLGTALESSMGQRWQSQRWANGPWDCLKAAEL